LIAASNVPDMPATIGIFSDGAMTSYVIVPKEALLKVSLKVPSHIRAVSGQNKWTRNGPNKWSGGGIKRGPGWAS
jgi:hypothetical protein